MDFFIETTQQLHNFELNMDLTTGNHCRIRNETLLPTNVKFKRSKIRKFKLLNHMEESSLQTDALNCFKNNNDNDINTSLSCRRCFYFLAVIISKLLYGSAKRYTSSSASRLVVFQAVILFVFIFLSSFTGIAQAEPELLQRQYSSSVYGSQSDAAAASVPETHLSLSSVQRCPIHCKSSKPRRFCASDGLTYISKCEIRKAARCEGKDITMVSRGSCPESREKLTGRHHNQQQQTPSSQNCHEILRQASRYPHGEQYRPSCHDNGTFQELQCFQQYCWYSNSNGTPISDTTVKNRQANCSTVNGQTVCTKEQDRSNKIKRTPINSNKCTRGERTHFNFKLVNLFHTEFKNSAQQDNQRSVNHQSPGVVEWKYRELDKNKDGILNGSEVKSLNRLVRKAVRPLKCAKRFPNYCDEDKNREITEAEWSRCLDDNSRPPRRPFDDDDDDEDDDDRSENIGDGSPAPVNPFGLNDRNPSIDSNEEMKTEPSDEPDCFAARAAAEKSDREDPLSKIFVPECITGGLYRKEQCHKVSGYCFCVDERTGAPILSGYYTRNEMPDCSKAMAERPVEGCPYGQKKMFVTQILDLLSQQMVTFAADNPLDSKIPMDADLSLEEKAVLWKFSMLDTNTNNELTRKETKSIQDMFKRTSSGRPLLRKCARKYLRYCDESDDSRISRDEWVTCLKLTESASGDGENNPRGKNPVTQFLKS